MLFQHHLLKILSLLYCFAFVLLSKISLLYLWRSISGFSILLHWFTRLFFDQHHTVLTTNPEMPPVWSMKLITYRMELWSSSYLDLWSVEADIVHVTNLKCTSLPPFSGKWQKPSLNLSRGRNAVAQKNEKKLNWNWDQIYSKSTSISLFLSQSLHFSSSFSGFETKRKIASPKSPHPMPSRKFHFLQVFAQISFLQWGWPVLTLFSQNCSLYPSSPDSFHHALFLYFST